MSIAPSDIADRDATLAGVLLMLAGMAAFPTMDAISKLLAAEYSGVQVTWARYFFHFLPKFSLPAHRACAVC